MSPIHPSSGRGYVYFLVNDAMPGLLKIGFTESALDQRLAQLQTTGVPRPFTLGAAFEVADVKECEAELHRLLADKRESKQREFFRVDLVKAIAICHEVIRQHMGKAVQIDSPQAPRDKLEVGEADIYFMQFILHDGSERQWGLSTRELAPHHLKYHPLELERKLIRLSEMGLIKKVGRDMAPESRWGMTSEGIKFMFDGGHTLQDIFNNYREHP